MKFKQWLNEYEGNNFSQEEDLVNGSQFPNSKYKGKGDKDDSAVDSAKIKNKYGMRSNDEILKMKTK